MQVLVVDDYPDAAALLCDLLGLLGCTCRAALSGEEALSIAREQRPELVILDIGLPDLSGYEVAPRLRALLAPDSVRIAALTGWGQPTDRARSAAAGFDQHVVKPPTLAKLKLILGM